MSARGSRAAIVVLVLCALAAGAAALAASALAAHPKKGAHFSGSFTFTGINGFKAPVTFSVSHDGKALTGFTYSTLGCFGSGGFRPGVNYYTKPSALIKVGTVKVSSSGHFSATGSVSRYTVFGYTTVTTTTLSGSFSSSKAASGHLSFSEKLAGVAVGAGGGPCKSNVLTFKVKA